MSGDREEIRWKMQILLEILSFTKDMHDAEFKSLADKWDKSYSDLISVRNIILGGIGFGIGLWVGLMSLDIIIKSTAILIIIPIVIGLIIFIIINSYAFKESQKIYRLEKLYQNHSLELIKVKSWIAGHSLRDDVTNEEIITIVLFNSLITQAISYEAKFNVYKEFKSGKPIQEEYRLHYNTAKNLPTEFNIFSIEGFPVINSFIKLFELNESEN